MAELVQPSWPCQWPWRGTWPSPGLSTWTRRPCRWSSSSHQQYSLLSTIFQGWFQNSYKWIIKIMSRFFEFATREINLEMLDSNTNQTGSKQDPQMNYLTQPYQAGSPTQTSVSFSRWVLVSTPLRQVFKGYILPFHQPSPLFSTQPTWWSTCSGWRSSWWSWGPTSQYPSSTLLLSFCESSTFYNY